MPIGSPLHYCLQQFGGLLAFCSAIGRHPKTIYRWRDAGGFISSDAQTEAVLAAKRLGIELDPSRLVYNPPVAVKADSVKE